MARLKFKNLGLTLIAVTLMMGVRVAAFGQFGLNSGSDFGSGSVTVQQLSYVDKKGNVTQPTKSAYEAIRGNGTRAGYMLSHGGVVPGTVRVSVGARILRANTDFYLDYASGMLVFAEAVRTFDSVSCSYSYVDGYDASRGVSGLPGMALNFKGTALNLAYGVSASNGANYNTYGLSMNSSVAKGASLKGLLYFSSAASSNGNIIARTSANQAGPTRAAATKASNDRLIDQALTVNSGKASFRASYQDVGASFSGFQTMRQSLTGNADALSQIANLEKERGIKRMGFGAGLAVGKQGNLTADWGRVNDGSGTINQQTLALTSGALNLSYSAQQIGTGFSAFKNLRDAQAGQWAREKGISRSDLTMGFAPGKGSALSFNRQTIGDTAGAITRTGFGYTGKTMGFAFSSRQADQNFRRIGDLSDADKTALALDIRKQFNANATAGEVTQRDKEQIGLDAGLDRSRMSFNTALGKDSKAAFNQFRISDSAGDIQRRTMSLSGKGFTVDYLSQSIGSTFGRLGAMSDFERSQFGNEVGITRSHLAIGLAVSKTSSLAFTNSSATDAVGNMAKQSLTYTAKGLDFRMNTATVSKSFARANDLAGLQAPERQQIEAERGFKRTDYTLGFTGIKGLTLNSYVYSARNAADDLTRGVYRHALALTPDKASRITYLTEGNTNTSAGVISNGTRHSLITMDRSLGKGMRFSVSQDTVSTIANGLKASNVTNTFSHFETDRSKAANLMAEMRQIKSADGTFENTTLLDANFRAGKTMTFNLNHLAIDRGTRSSATTDMLRMNWQMSKTMAFAGQFGQTRTNDGNDASTKGISLSGPVGKMLALTGSYLETSVLGKNVRSVSDITMSSTKSFSFLGMSNANASLRFASTFDQHKTQTQTVGGKLQGMVGKNQLAFEYGGALAQNGTGGISRAISFVSDRNDKLPFHFDMMYKARNVNKGNVQLVRKYNFGYNMDKLTQMTYTYSSLPEDGAGNMVQTRNSVFSLKRTLSRSFNLALDYTTGRNIANGQGSRKLGANLTGRLSKVASLTAGYSVDINNINGANTNAHTFSLGLDRRIDADHVLAMTTSYTVNANGTANAAAANVEFRARF